MAKSICSAKGCERLISCKGLCSVHYSRWWKIHRAPLVPPKPCIVDGCTDSAKARGWCSSHYSRWYEHGTPHAGGTKNGAPLAFAFAAVNTDSDDCIPWPYTKKWNGYGVLQVGDKAWTASRYVLSLATGGDRPGLDAAHAPIICHNRGCINPRHLRWATRAENLADKKLDGT